jgi:hypothetical protein
MNTEDIIRMAREARLWDTFDDDSIGALERFAALVAAAERKEWQGLTDEEIEAGFITNTCCDDLVVYEHIARAIEAKLKEKNT